MRVRIYSPYCPYPVTEGAFQVISEQAFGFARAGHKVELVFWKGKSATNDIFERLGIQLIDWTKASAASETPSSRFWRTISSLWKTDPSPSLFYYPLESDRRAELGGCDLAIYHYTYSMSWLTHESQKSIRASEKKRVVYFHNVESDLFRFRAQAERNPVSKFIHNLNARKLTLHEREILDLIDEGWQISPLDLAQIRARYPEVRVPQSLRVPTYSSELMHSRKNQFKELDDKSDGKVYLGFIGRLDFEPNRLSLEWILNNVCPLLEQRGFAGELLVAGKAAGEELLRLGKPYPFVKFLGFTPSLDSFWARLSLMMVPDVSGSGVRIKLLDALASGLPALANSQAVDRLHPDLRASPFLIEKNEPAAWADFLMNLNGSERRRQSQHFDLDKALSFDFIYPEYRI